MDRKRHTAGTFTFLRTSADTGLIYASIAWTANDEEKVRRHRANARRAYNSIQHFIKQVELTSDEKAELTPKVEKLKRELHALGEPV
jgi:hypothetical protein